VDEPTDCSRLLSTLPVPSSKAGKNSKSVLARTQKNLMLADDNIVQAKECLADQSDQYKAPQ
jgi:hypothetical protein